MQRGEKIDIPYGQFGLYLGWKWGTVTGPEYALDLSAFVLTENQKLLVYPDDDKGFSAVVFYGNEGTPDEAVRQLDSDGAETDDEGYFIVDDLFLNLEKLDPRAVEIVFAASDFNALDLRYLNSLIWAESHWGEVFRYEPKEDFSGKDTIELGRLIKKGNSWEFEATGIGYEGGLDYLVNKYKVEDWG